MFKRECVPDIAGKTIFADKRYRDNPYWNGERESKNNELLTPVKAVKGATEGEIQRNRHTVRIDNYFKFLESITKQ